MEESVAAQQPFDDFEARHEGWISPREKELTAQGWTKRFTLPTMRLNEFVQVYDSLGFEVLLEPVVPDLTREDCASCQILDCLLLKTVYTRPGK
ncbi:MAG: hypothetical protein A2Z04_02375 [Chloroflexi bacterium RBG_16_57_9]|nr:MAG: hypothetical protein A2Z04_02375 [Chloroflexi bacterium RBG_16_57_9]